MISVTGEEREASRPIDWGAVRRVLLLRLRSIGDTVLMTPCLAALKSFQPDLHITVVSEPLSAPLLEDHPFVEQLLVTSSSLRARARLVAALRRQAFDVGINLHGGTTAMVLTWLSGARYTTAFEDYRFASLLTHPAPAPDKILGQQTIHSVEQQLALLYWLGIPRPITTPTLQLSVAESATESVRHRLTDCGLGAANGEQTGSPFAILAPAAAMESKRWATAAFARLSEHLASRWAMPSVLMAGRGQEDVAERVAAQSQAKPRVVTGLDLKELMALINLSSLFVGNDSGPMHIAAALRRPLVGIFGSSNVAVWRPWTIMPARVVQAPQAADAATRIRQISVAEVSEAVDQVLQETFAVTSKGSEQHTHKS